MKIFAVAAVVSGALSGLAGQHAESAAVQHAKSAAVQHAESAAVQHTESAAVPQAPAREATRGQSSLPAAVAASLPESRVPAEASSPPPEITPDELTAVVRRVCAACHNDQLLTGNLSLQHFDVAAAPEMAQTAEKMIVKLRAGMMPDRKSVV